MIAYIQFVASVQCIADDLHVTVFIAAMSPVDAQATLEKGLKAGMYILDLNFYYISMYLKGMWQARTNQ